MTTTDNGNVSEVRRMSNVKWLALAVATLAMTGTSFITIELLKVVA